MLRKSDAAKLRVTSGRYRELHGVTVRTDTPEHFMDDLKKYGYIKG